MVESLLANKLDLAWVDSEHLAQARSLSNGGVIPIVQRADDATSGRTYQWAVRSGLDSNLRERLADAFLVMNQDETNGSEFLHYQHTSRYMLTLPPVQ
jgi:ABC-type phosphate/phosphonate transport system substrate-binding protein